MIFLRILTGLGLLALGLSHLGAILPFGDSLSVGRIHLLLGGLIVLVFLRHFSPGLGRLVGLVLVLSLGQTIWAWRGGASHISDVATADLVLYQKNLLFINGTKDAIAEEIRASGALVVTLQEVHDNNLPILDALKDTYPHQLRCTFAGVGGTALLSKRPFVGGGAACGDKGGLTLAQIVLPGGPVWIGALHLHWPWPYGQAAQVSDVLERLETLEGPVILAGDFNMQPWGSSVIRIARTIDANRLGGYGITFPHLAPFVPLIIDHVLIPKGAKGAIERRDLFGSDHRGLIAWIDLP